MHSAEAEPFDAAFGPVYGRLAHADADSDVLVARGEWLLFTPLRNFGSEFSMTGIDPERTSLADYGFSLQSGRSK
jgi:hypothetical protein